MNDKKVTALTALFVVVTFWVFYLVRVLFGIGFGFEGEPGKPADPVVFLVAAICVTFIVPLIAAWFIRKKNILLSRGEWTVGEVTQVSLLGRLDTGPIHVTFQAGGRQYTVKKDAQRGLSRGDKIRVFFDPVNPKRCEFHPAEPDQHVASTG